MMSRQPFIPIRINLREASHVTSIEQRNNLSEQPRPIHLMFFVLLQKPGVPPVMCILAALILVLTCGEARLYDADDEAAIVV